MNTKITRYLIPLLILTIIITFCSFSCSTPGPAAQTIEETAQVTAEEITVEEPEEEVKEEVAAEEPVVEEVTGEPEEVVVEEEEEIEEETPADLLVYPELKEMPAEDKDALIRPVDERYFESALIDEKDPQVLSFYLDSDEPIKAIFKGKVREIFKDQKPFPDDNAFDEILLDREDGQFYASYVIFGEVLVNEGDMIEQGQEIAKAKEGGLGFRLGTNLSLWIHDKNGGMVELSKEMFIK